MRWFQAAKCVASVLAINLAVSLGNGSALANRERILELAWHQVFHLRVSGSRDRLGHSLWKQQGTGFVIKTQRREVDYRYRIITAGHVVGRDEDWSKVGTGVSRSISHRSRPNGIAPKDGLLGTPGVDVHPSRDIAQVFVSAREQMAGTIQPIDLVAGASYFVVSWGVDETGEAAVAPYVKEVSYNGIVQASDGSDLALLESVGGQDKRTFVPTESGSPVYDSLGNIVAIVVRERKEAGAQVATSALALPMSTVSDWIKQVMKEPQYWPPPLAINLADQTAASIVGASVTGSTVKLADASAAILKAMTIEVQAKRATPVSEAWQAAVLKAGNSSHRPVEPDPQSVAYGLKLLEGGCVFLGKYSARKLSPANNRYVRDVPFGADLLHRAIGLFPEENPHEVSDDRASLVARNQLKSEAPAARWGGLKVDSHCPTSAPSPDRENNWERIAYWPPLAGKVEGRAEVTFDSVLRQAYLGDFFYWGIVARIRQVE